MRQKENDKIEQEIKEKLKQFTQEDIVFLKEEWTNKIAEGDSEFFRKLKGINVHVIYDILDESKIKKIRKAEHGNRYVITVYHSRNFEIEIIVKFDVPARGLLGIITYIKKKIN